MKMPIHWHEDCLRNRIASRNRIAGQLELLQGSLNYQDNEIQRIRHQLAEAKRRKVTAFDPDKFALKMPGKEPK